MEFVHSLAALLLGLFWAYLCISGWLVAIVVPAMVICNKKPQRDDKTEMAYFAYIVGAAAMWLAIFATPLYMLLSA
jgi:hypothetical protein